MTSNMFFSGQLLFASTLFYIALSHLFASSQNLSITEEATEGITKLISYSLNKFAAVMYFSAGAMIITGRLRNAAIATISMIVLETVLHVLFSQKTDNFDLRI